MLDDKAKQLAIDNMPLVPYTLRRYFGASNAKDEDNMADGYEALCRAAERYDPSKGVTFAAYAIPAIYNGMRLRLRRERAIKRTLDRPIISLDQPINTDGDTVADLIAADADSTATEAEREHRYAEIRRLIEELMTIAPELVQNKRGYKQAEIAQMCGVQRGAVSMRIRRQKYILATKYGDRYRRVMYGTDDRAGN